MAKRFGGTINIDIKDSVPDWEPYAQPMPPDGRAERALRRPRRRRLLGDGVVRRPDRDAEHQADRRPRPHLHELPHDGALLADSLLPADGSQPHDELDGVHHRGGVGIPERERSHPGRVRDDPGRPRRARLEHVHRRQVASLPRGRDEHGVDEEGLAARARLRALLRLPRRRDEPVVSRPHATTTTPVDQPKLPEEGYHFSVDITDKALSFIKDAKVVAPDKPFFLYYAFGAAHAPHHAPTGMGRQVQGQVRHGLRGLPRARLREPEEARDPPGAAPSCRRSIRTPT